MIKREILTKIENWLGREKILIIKGARQVGKTFLLKEIKKGLEKEDKKVIYLLADDIDNKEIFKSLSSLESYLQQVSDFPNEYIYLMIDEFQVINQSGILLKNIFDKHKKRIQLIVSGSSSLEINKNSEFLTGRAIHFNVNRINFQEYFNYSYSAKLKYFYLEDFNDVSIFWQTFKPKIELCFRNYLAYGAYPEVLTANKIEDKEEILKSIIKTYIDKDIINHLKIENIEGFNNLIKVLCGQIGQLVNKNELTNTTNISINTLNKYLDVLVGTYIINLISPYYKNIRTEISKMTKVYVLDIGIYHYLLRTFNMDLSNKGEVIENFVYNVFKSKFSQEYIHFYRTNSGAEIDFVIEDKQSKLLICEVKYSSKVKVPLVFNNFSKKYNNISKKIIVTKNLLKKEADTYYIPAPLLAFIDFFSKL